MPFSDEQALWEYYAAAAKKLGRDKDGREQKYSVRWYFADHSPEKNILTRAFLGEPRALELVRRAILGQASPEELNELYDGRGSAQYDEKDFLEGSPQPDDAQKNAIRAALTMPISFIKGPPGTGKTSAILHLLSCILRQGKTAAMVSSNNTAIRAVTDKLDTYTDSAEPKKYALYNAFARLGNSSCREAFENAHRELFGGKRCSAMPSEQFLCSRPIIASTIHSLPKCFSDWKKTGREPVYDYVVVDESSQVNALLGLIAMGGARHLVLVGDDDQLPPVTNEDRIKQGTVDEEKKAADDIQGFEDIYALREERSFLGVCKEVFLGDNDDLDKKCSKMLRFHYRCHPGIISFCRQEAYNSGGEKLEIRTREYDRSHPTPIRVVWFEGTFCESVQRDKKAPQRGKKAPSTKRNRRQSEIFMQEEWPDLLDRLCADPCSVLGVDREGHRPFRFGVLSPFKGQLWDLRDRLKRWLEDTDNQKMIRKKAIAHKPALTGSDGRVVPFQSSVGDGKSKGKPEDEAFLRKLIRYAWDNGPGGPGPWIDGPFGFHRARSHSIFERRAAVEWRRRRVPDMKKPYPSHYPSAPEICLQDWLSRSPLAVDNKLSVYIDAPISAITPPPDLPEDRRDRLKEYIDNGAHFDCVICQGERVLMVIEVDGEFHRTDGKDRKNRKKQKKDNNKENDKNKNTIVGRGFGAAMYTAREDGFVPMEDSAPVSGSGFTFLRLPTDGAAWDEGKTIETLLAERLGTQDGPVYPCPFGP